MKEKLPPKVLPFSFHSVSYAGISVNERKDRKKKFRRQEIHDMLFLTLILLFLVHMCARNETTGNYFG